MMDEENGACRTAAAQTEKKVCVLHDPAEIEDGRLSEITASR